MGLDLRLPIGIMFSLVGALLAIYGLMTASSPETYRCSLNININLWWGLVLLVFGVLMYVAAWRSQVRDSAKEQKPPAA